MPAEKTIKAPVDLILLDEISRKLDRLVEIMEMQIPEGVVGPAIEMEVTTDKEKVTISSKGVRSLEIINSGSTTVKVLINSDDGYPTKILPGESLRVDSQFRIWRYIYVWTDTSTSNIRINYTY